MDYKVIVPLAILLNIWEYIKGLFGYYTWEPKDRLTNNATKNINSYPKDLKLKNGDLCLDNGDLALTSKEEAFAQHLQTFISLKIGELHYNPEYGCEFVDSIFQAKSKEFQRQCEHLAKAIIQNPSFKDYIEEIYEIRRKKEGFMRGGVLICIEFKLKGRPNTFVVELSNITYLLEKRRKMDDKKI